MKKQRARIHYTEAQKALMWERWQKGESLQQIAQLFDRNHSSIQPILAATGGIRPAPRCRSRWALTLAEREEISRAVVAGHSRRSIAAQLGRAPSTISRELKRNGGQACYRASQADQSAWDRGRRDPRVGWTESPDCTIRKQWDPGPEFPHRRQRAPSYQWRERGERPGDSTRWTDRRRRRNDHQRDRSKARVYAHPVSRRPGSRRASVKSRTPNRGTMRACPKLFCCYATAKNRRPSQISTSPAMARNAPSDLPSSFRRSLASPDPSSPHHPRR